MRLEFSRRIFEKKNTHISNFMKIRPVGAESFRADGRTDMTNLTEAFRKFANAPKNNRRNSPQTWTLQPWSFSCCALAAAAALAISDSGRVRHRFSSSLVRSLVRSQACRQLAINLRGIRGDTSCSATLPRESRSDLLSWFSFPSWFLKLSLLVKLERLLSFMLLCLLAVFSFKPGSMSSAALHIVIDVSRPTWKQNHSYSINTTFNLSPTDFVTLT